MNGAMAMLKAELVQKLNEANYIIGEQEKKIAELRGKLNTDARANKELVQQLNNDLIVANSDIERLDSELKAQRLSHQNRIHELKNDFLEQYNNQVQKLNDEFKQKEKELIRLRAKEDEMNKIIAGEYFKPKHNERNAGRKSIITYDLASKVRSMHDSGMSQKLISKQLCIAVGTVNKILKSNTSVDADQRDGDPDADQCTL